MQIKTRILDKEMLTKEEAALAFQKTVERVKKNITIFKDCFPGACSSGNEYQKTENDDWTNGFFTGQMWLSYDATGEEVFKETALRQVDSFLERIKNRVVVDHHDMGFLYSPSCVAAYLLVDSQIGKEAALLAAHNLLGRFQEKGGFFQAWGPMGKSEEYRLIIDCLMNLPLLFWASRETGERAYEDKALKHIETALKVLVREDASTYHTYYFDPESGAPVKGATQQGNRNDSIWARGQSWGIYGIALSYARTKSPIYLELFERVADCFLTHLPEDLIPYWDFDFEDGSDQPRDSSSAAIAACGFLEMAKYVDEERKREYRKFAAYLLKALTEQCLYKEEDATNGILLHSTYCQGRNADGSLMAGADECTMWGDYFYMEALIRMQRDWQGFW